MSEKDEVMKKVSKSYDNIEHGSITIEKRGKNNPVDVVSTGRERVIRDKQERRG